MTEASVSFAGDLTDDPSSSPPSPSSLGPCFGGCAVGGSRRRRSDAWPGRQSDRL